MGDATLSTGHRFGDSTRAGTCGYPPKADPSKSSSLGWKFSSMASGCFWTSWIGGSELLRRLACIFFYLQGFTTVAFFWGGGLPILKGQFFVVVVNPFSPWFVIRGFTTGPLFRGFPFARILRMVSRAKRGTPPFWGFRLNILLRMAEGITRWQPPI